jgi:hypothetical protein
MGRGDEGAKGTGDVAQGAKALAAKPGLSSVPRTHHDGMEAERKRGKN